MPIYDENLQYKQGGKQRRPIRQVADVIGVAAGPSWVEGEITMEVLPDCLPFWLYVSRNSVTKTGSGPYTYTCTPSHVGSGTINTGKGSASLTIVRNDIVFGYVGCVVTGMEFTIDEQVLMVKISILGFNEAVQTSPTPTWPTTVPFQAGQYDLSVGGSTVTDTDSFTFSVDDSGEPQHRIRNSRIPTAIKWGERSLSCKLERDFENRTEYDAFKSYTSNAIALDCVQDANNRVTITLPANIKENWDLGLSGQGDIVRSSIDYVPIYNPGTSKAYEIVVITGQNIT
jgi:hypothetical protein